MALEWWQLAALTAVGVASGFLNVMAGGGSLLSVPVMLFMGLPGPVANGTNRIAILAQNITAVRTFANRGFAEFRLSLSLAACALPGAVIGALLGTRLEGAWFERVVAIIMIGVMILMALGADRTTTDSPGPETPSRRRLIWGHLLMIGVGCYGGFIQLGVGFLIMPVLHRVLGFDLVRTNMHKVFIIAVYTAAALLVFAARVELLWWVGAALALGNATGGWLATHVQVQRGETVIRTVLNVVLVVFIIKLLFFPGST
jgi:uncharacterized membrane protein YfcA